MTPQEWAEKLYYDLSFAAPEMHLTHIVNRIAQAMDDAVDPDLARKAAAWDRVRSSVASFEAYRDDREASLRDISLAYDDMKSAIAAALEQGDA